MGREAKVMKSRICPHCKRKHTMSAKQLIEHTKLMERLEKINLIDPANERTIIVP